MIVGYMGMILLITMIIPFSEIVLVGESPGREELIAGQPFIGRAGRLLDKGLLLAGLNRDEISVLNSAKCLIPKEALDAKGLTNVLTNCRQFIKYALTSIKPKLVICLGEIALRQVMGLKGISKLRGNISFGQMNFNAV